MHPYYPFYPDVIHVRKDAGPTTSNEKLGGAWGRGYLSKFEVLITLSQIHSIIPRVHK